MKLLDVAARFVTRPRNVGIAAACVAATAMGVAATTPVWDPDVWWVAAAGQQTLAQGAVPHQNVFSYIEPTHAWLMHEWLLGPAYASLLARFGPAAFDAVAACSMACALTLLAAATVGRARHAVVGLAAMLAAVAFFGGRFLSARPTGVALLFPVALVLVAFGRRFAALSIALAGAIELVWANVHGSFPLGIVLLLVAAIDGARDRGRRLAAAAIAGAATFVTPYGLALHRFVWSYFRGSEGIYRAINLHITEFGTLREAWGTTVGPVDLLGLVGVAILGASAARYPRHRARALLCLGLCALALQHARHLELAGLMSCMLLVPHADALVDRASGRTAGTPSRPNPRGWRMAALLLLPAYVAGPVAFAVMHGRRAPEDWIAAGPSFLRTLGAVPDGASALVPFQAAGLAIWYGFPRGVRVFFDSRNDAYSVAAFDAFWALEASSTPPGDRRESLERTRTDAAVVRRGDPLSVFLSSEAGWCLARQEGGWQAYLRAPCRAENGAARTGPGAARGTSAQGGGEVSR